MVNLFSNQPGMEEYEKAAEKLKALKRGCYNKKPKPIDPYVELHNIYTYLSRFFARPNFPEKEDEVVFCNGFILNIEVYTSEAYSYEGDIYRGENFIEALAELEGTENFNVEERLQLHREVEALLKQDVTLEVAYNKVKPKIVRLQQKYRKQREELLAKYKDDGGERWRRLLLG